MSSNHVIDDRPSQRIVDNCLNDVVQVIRSHGFTSLGDFLCATFENQDGKMKQKLSHLFNGATESYFHRMLTAATQHSRAADGIVQKEVMQRAPHIIANEVARLYDHPGLRCPDPFDQKSQLEFSFDEAADIIENTAPFWCSLMLVSSPKRLRRLSATKFDDNRTGCVLQILQNMFLRCQQINRFQTVIALYLMSTGAQRDVFTVMNQFGMSISYASTLNRMSDLSKSSLKDMKNVNLLDFLLNRRSHHLLINIAITDLQEWYRCNHN